MERRDLITVNQLSEILGVHRVTIRKWVSKGRIPYYRLGRAVRFSLDEVLQASRKSDEGGAR